MTSKLLTTKNALHGLISTTQRFTTRRAELEAELAAEFESGKFELDAATIERFSTAMAGATLAEKVEVRLRQSVTTAFHDAANAAIQAAIELQNNHKMIDARIRSAIQAAMPKGVGEITFDIKSSTAYRAEQDARWAPQGRIGGPLSPGASLTELETRMTDLMRYIESIEVEFCRCAAVLASFEPKAA